MARIGLIVGLVAIVAGLGALFHFRADIARAASGGETVFFEDDRILFESEAYSKRFSVNEAVELRVRVKQWTGIPASISVLQSDDFYKWEKGVYGLPQSGRLSPKSGWFRTGWFPVRPDEQFSLNISVDNDPTRLREGGQVIIEIDQRAALPSWAKPSLHDDADAIKPESF